MKTILYSFESIVSGYNFSRLIYDDINKAAITVARSLMQNLNYAFVDCIIRGNLPIRIHHREFLRLKQEFEPQG